MKLKSYRWKGVNRLQQKQQGLIVAENETTAQQLLFQRGLQSIKLQQNWQFHATPKASEICDLLSQLALLLSSAVPLKNTLQILQQNCTNIALNLWLTLLLKDLERGLAFSQALAQQGLYLSVQERQLIQVGEMTGKLAHVCEQIAQYKQQALALQRKLQKILLYPLMVLGISLSLTLGLLLFIVPQFAEMYGNNQAQLPAFTAFLLALSNGLKQYFYHILLLSLLLIGLLRSQLKRSLWLNKQKDRLLAVSPILGRIVQLSRLVGFCRSLCLMLESGIPLNQGLQSFLPNNPQWQRQQIQGDHILLEEIQSTLYWLKQGYTFSQSVGSRLFPQQAQQILQVGEKSGQLSHILLHIANNYQQQLNHQIDLLSQLLEPLLMVIIGALIGLIMLGMYLPIFNMGALIQ